MIMSDYPESEPLEDEWTESDRECPQCGKGLWTAGWWDDPSDSGGACIGTLYECGSCSFYESD